jgi:hypothetical protein
VMRSTARWATVAEAKLSHFDVGIQVRNNCFCEPDQLTVTRLYGLDGVPTCSGLVISQN